jgi:hypothetical protein
MEFGGKEKQFFASQTSQVPVSGGKGWQFYATHFAKNNENGCKTKETKAKTCIPKHREQGFWWQVFRFGGERYIHNRFKQGYGRQTKRVFGLSCISDFPNTLVCLI